MAKCEMRNSEKCIPGLIFSNDYYENNVQAFSYEFFLIDGWEGGGGVPNKCIPLVTHFS